MWRRRRPPPSMKSIFKSVGGRETGEIGDQIRMRDGKLTLVTLNPKIVNPKGTHVVEVGAYNVAPKAPCTVLKVPPFWMKRLLKCRGSETGEIGHQIRKRGGKLTLVTLNPQNPTPVNPKGTRDVEVGVRPSSPLLVRGRGLRNLPTPLLNLLAIYLLHISPLPKFLSCRAESSLSLHLWPLSLPFLMI